MGFLEEILNKFRPEWRERFIRRKTVWHLPKVILSFVLLGLFWYLLFRGMWQIHLAAYPSHAGHLDQFWREGIGFKSFISSFLMVMPLFLPAIGASFILVNLLFWLIRPIRQSYEEEAAGNPEMTFSGATARLVKIFFRYLLPIGLGLSLIGALTLSKI